MLQCSKLRLCILIAFLLLISFELSEATIEDCKRLLKDKRFEDVAQTKLKFDKSAVIKELVNLTGKLEDDETIKVTKFLDSKKYGEVYVGDLKSQKNVLLIIEDDSKYLKGSFKARGALMECLNDLREEDIEDKWENLAFDHTVYLHYWGSCKIGTSWRRYWIVGDSSANRVTYGITLKNDVAIYPIVATTAVAERAGFVLSSLNVIYTKNKILHLPMVEAVYERSSASYDISSFTHHLIKIGLKASTNPIDKKIYGYIKNHNLLNFEFLSDYVQGLVRDPEGEEEDETEEEEEEDEEEEEEPAQQEKKAKEQQKRRSVTLKPKASEAKSMEAKRSLKVEDSQKRMGNLEDDMKMLKKELEGVIHRKADLVDLQKLSKQKNTNINYDVENIKSNLQLKLSSFEEKMNNSIQSREKQLSLLKDKLTENSNQMKEYLTKQKLDMEVLKKKVDGQSVIDKRNDEEKKKKDQAEKKNREGKSAVISYSCVFIILNFLFIF